MSPGGGRGVLREAMVGRGGEEARSKMSTDSQRHTTRPLITHKAQDHHHRQQAGHELVVVGLAAAWLGMNRCSEEWKEVVLQCSF